MKTLKLNLARKNKNLPRGNSTSLYPAPVVIAAAKMFDAIGAATDRGVSPYIRHELESLRTLSLELVTGAHEKRNQVIHSTKRTKTWSRTRT